MSALIEHYDDLVTSIDDFYSRTGALMDVPNLEEVEIVVNTKRGRVRVRIDEDEITLTPDQET